MAVRKQKKQNYVGAPKGNQNAKGNGMGGKSKGAAAGGAAGAGAVIGVSSALNRNGKTFLAGGSKSIAGKSAGASVTGGLALGGGSRSGQVVLGAGMMREKKIGFTTARYAEKATKSGRLGAAATSINLAGRKGQKGLAIKGLGVTAPAALVAGVAGAAVGTAAGAAYNRLKKRKKK
jgi:hypothetical protein